MAIRLGPARSLLGIVITWFAWVLTFVPSYLGTVAYATGIPDSDASLVAFIIGFGLVLAVTSGGAATALHLLRQPRALETGAALFAAQLICGALVPVLLYGAVFAFPVLPIAARIVACRIGAFSL